MHSATQPIKDENTTANNGINDSSSSSNNNSNSRANIGAGAAMTNGVSKHGGGSKYKRRTRVYDRMRNARKAKPLQTVPENGELKERHQLMNPKIVGLILLAFVCVAGMKEMYTLIMSPSSSSSSSSFLSDTKGSGSMQVRQQEDSSLRRGGYHSPEAEEASDQAVDQVRVPIELENLADLLDPLELTDRAVFWHVPRSGGGTIKDVTAHCFGLVLASEAGSALQRQQELQAQSQSSQPVQLQQFQQQQQQQQQPLTIVTDLDGGKYVNVDVTTREGIAEAATMGISNLEGLTMIATPYLYESGLQLLSRYHRGRVFTMLRHPIERAASMYHYLSGSVDSTVIDGLTLEDYAKSDKVEMNWMVHFLTNTPDSEEVTADVHLPIAKRILRDKVLIGLLHHKGESLRRFETYFGWQLDGEKMEDCHTKVLDWSWPQKNKHPPIHEGSEAWKLLKGSNELDVALYHYAENLFREQGEIFKQ